MKKMKKNREEMKKGERISECKDGKESIIFLA